MASRFWVGGTGTWDASDTTHWSATDGGGSGASVPGSADTVTLNGNSGGGTVTVNTTVTVQSITCGAFTGTLDFSANNNNVTLSASAAFSGSGSGVRTINLGNGTWSLTTTTAGVTPFSLNVTTNLTFSANSSTIDFTGAVAFGSGQTFITGSQTFSTVKVSGARHDSGLHITGGATIAVLTNTAAAYISLLNACTITTLTQSAQLTLALQQRHHHHRAVWRCQRRSIPAQHERKRLMLHAFKNGQTSIVLRVKLLDSSSTTGAGLTGLTSASASLIISTIADNEATATAYTQAGSTIESITTLGTFAAPTATKCRFKEVDATNHKGIYEFQFADARFAVSSAKSLLVSVARRNQSATG
jgi:hypothetical protein